MKTKRYLIISISLILILQICFPTLAAELDEKYEYCLFSFDVSSSWDDQTLDDSLIFYLNENKDNLISCAYQKIDASSIFNAGVSERMVDGLLKVWEDRNIECNIIRHETIKISDSVDAFRIENEVVSDNKKYIDKYTFFDAPHAFLSFCLRMPADSVDAGAESLYEELINTVSDLSMDPEVIIIVQKSLNDAGYDCGSADGIIGPNTQGAIEKYRRDNSLPADILIDVDLIEKLGLKDTVNSAVTDNED